jgi:uncharacterized protein YjbJ (UPF0337 family)
VGKSAQELRHDIERTREDLGETLDAIGDRVSPGRIVQRRTERVRNALTSVKTSVMGAGESAQSGAQGAVHSAQEQAASAVGTVADTARQAPQQVLRQTQGNPLAAGLVAFGVGLVVASLIPPTKPEQQAAAAVQDTIEPLKERAVEAAGQVKDEVTDAARTAAGQVKETAGQAADEVRHQAQESAEQVKGDAQAAAEDVRRG